MSMDQRPRRILARSAGILLLVSLAMAACGPGSERGAPAARAEPETVPTTTSIPLGGRQPTAEDPLRVLFVGNSLGSEVAAPSMAALQGGGSAVAFFAAVPGIPRGPVGGLYWSNTLDQYDPEVVVLLIGVWERLDLNRELEAGQTLLHYRTDVIDALVDQVTSEGAELLWVGSPLVRDTATNAELSFMNEIFENVGQSEDEVTYIDATGRITGPAGEYVEVATAPGGSVERLRRLDGTHLCPEGAALMAEPVIEYVTDRWNVDVDQNWRVGAWRTAEPFGSAPTECPTPG